MEGGERGERSDSQAPLHRSSLSLNHSFLKQLSQTWGM